MWGGTQGCNDRGAYQDAAEEGLEGFSMGTAELHDVERKRQVEKDV